MSYVYIIALVATFIATYACQRWISVLNRLDRAKEVIRVLYADWQSIPLYVTDSGELQCNLPDCPTGGFFNMPGRRTSLRAIVVAISEHMRLHHPDEVAKWKAK